SAYITTVETDESTYRAAVVPVHLAQDWAPGVYIEAADLQAELREVHMSLAIFISAGAGALLIGAIAAWLLVGGCCNRCAIYKPPPSGFPKKTWTPASKPAVTTSSPS